MSLISPGFGLIIWMIISFTIVLLILRKAAWQPILNGIHTREKSIEDALNAAEKAREEIANLKTDNEKILEEAKQEKNLIIQEGKELKNQLVNEAKAEAEKEAANIIESAKAAIQREQKAAVESMRKQITELSVSIAEKVLRSKLQNSEEQQAYIKNMLNDLTLN